MKFVNEDDIIRMKAIVSNDQNNNDATAKRVREQEKLRLFFPFFVTGIGPTDDLFHKMTGKT